jgi:hypothetical protein
MGECSAGARRCGTRNTFSAAVTDMRAIAKASPAGLAVHFTVPGGVAAYSSAALRDGLQTPLLRPGRRHLHPADHLSQPDPVAASGDLGWVGLDLSYRGSFVEHRSSGAGAAEQSGIGHDAEVAAYGAERHAGRRHELGGGGRGVKNRQQMGP